MRLETPDTNEGKELSGVCRALAVPLAVAAEAAGALVGEKQAREHPTSPRLHVLFVDGAHVYVGASAPPWSSPWPMGIPRIRMPHGAPSRSTLKLAEALVTFLGDREPDLLRAGMRAVDLGAAPGGWTWQLAQRGLRVTAVDNGALKGEVAQDSLVTHVRCATTALPTDQGARSTGWSATSSISRSRHASRHWWHAGSARAMRGARSSTSSCR